MALENAHIRLVVVLIVVITLNQVDVGILGDGSGVSLHNDDLALKSCKNINL